MESDSNKTTIKSYEGHLQAYIDGTPHVVTGDVQKWIDRSLDGVAYNSKILEIGSAFGRDAEYIETQGYVVERTDATVAFVDYLNDKHKNARVLNIITDVIDQKYDLIFADAVLLHFTRAETEHVIHKVHESLNPDGRFSFSVKQGAGETWSDDKLGAPRFFCYWDSEAIKLLLQSVGYSDVSVDIAGSDLDTTKWLHIIASK